MGIIFTVSSTKKRTHFVVCKKAIAICAKGMSIIRMKKETWKFILQTLAAVLTAIVTTLGVTFCLGV